jgi:8-amino-7-oxononanoate synthase
MTSLDDFANHKLDLLSHDAKQRSLPGRAGDLLKFCSNDYLGLAQDYRLKAAAIAATERYGSGAGASRLVTGNHPVYRELESRIAALKGTESALVFGSGYLANMGTIPALVSEGDVIFADELSHACMISGARLSGARVVLFRHNDVADLAALIDTHRADAQNALILTEGVFSMDGDMAPLADISALARQGSCWLMTDDAHGLGVVGGGRGSAAAFGIVPHIQMGTLSKAVGSLGGYVAASNAVVQLLVNRARTLIYATGLPPGVVAASSAGIDIIASDAQLCQKPLQLARQFARDLDLVPPQSAIVPLVLGGSAAALEASAALAEEGFQVTAIRPPTVPEGTARLRFTFCASHAEQDVARLAQAVKRLVHLPGRVPA